MQKWRQTHPCGSQLRGRSWGGSGRSSRPGPASHWPLCLQTLLPPVSLKLVIVREGGRLHATPSLGNFQRVCFLQGKCQSDRTRGPQHSGPDSFSHLRSRRFSPRRRVGGWRSGPQPSRSLRALPERPLRGERGLPASRERGGRGESQAQTLRARGRLQAAWLGSPSAVLGSSGLRTAWRSSGRQSAWGCAPTRQ